jgi:hypothetical protein
MNVKIGTKAAQFPEKENMNWIFVAVQSKEDIDYKDLLFPIMICNLYVSQ